MLEKNVNNLYLRHEERLNNMQSQIDFFVRTSLPPVEGVFSDGEVFDAYAFANDLIRSARRRLVLIDNYVDDSVLKILQRYKDAMNA